MTRIVADTSSLVSLGIPTNHDPDLLARCLDVYDLHVPEAVLDEVREVAAYDDVHGNAAESVLDRTDSMRIQSVALDPDFPLDDGENAAVTLANEVDAALLLCDEFNRLGLVHASLADTRLVTTPTLLSVFVRQDKLDPGEAIDLLDRISDARSWDANSYVQRARSRLAE